MNDLVVIKTYSNRTLAEIGKGLLESHHIKSVISADDAGGMYPSPMSPTGGAELLVDRKDLQIAKNLLEDT